MRCIAVVLALLLPSLLVSPVQAAGDEARCLQDDIDIEWREVRTQSFAIIYPAANEELAHTVLDLYGRTLDADYARFASLFETSLPLPISIRIYPTEDKYYRLNELVPALEPGATHSHVGTREIALIDENITLDVDWQQKALSALRYEVAILFVEQITDGKAPPGLQAGMGGYAGDPREVLGNSQRLSAMPSEPTATWQSLWESPDATTDPDLMLQAMSIVAYLVDVYGWPAFVEFLEGFPTAAGYRQALVSTYGIELGAMQEHWQRYFPVYFEGRWRANVIYGFDLSLFEQLLAAGAYADAAQGLKEAIDFLEQLGDEEKAEQAQALLLQAQTGQEASALVRQARQALQSRDYENCINLALQAQQKYEQIGDQRRLDEIDTYRAWAQEVLDLWAEIDQIQARIALDSTTASAGRLVEIGQRLGELGDEQGKTLVNEMLSEIEARQRSQVMTISAAGLSLCLVLLCHRILVLRRTPPPEAQLL